MKPCKHRGPPTGEYLRCPSCPQRVMLKVHECAVHQECTAVAASGVHGCHGCADQEEVMRWSYGVTAVPERKDELLPRTLASLAASGFPEPRLFVDGATDGFERFGLPVTYRYPRLRAFGNWWLAMVELYVRQPQAQRFAVFQDDIVCVRNLRAYLDATCVENRCYWNMFTSGSNHSIRPPHDGWYDSNQFGRGGLGIVMERQCVIEVLGCKRFTEHACDTHRGHCKLDGAVLEAAKLQGWKERVHNPSLLEHTGARSVIGMFHDRTSASFPGEDYDPFQLLHQR